MDSMGLTRYMSVLMDDAMKQARFFDHEFVMPEHMLLSLLRQYAFCQALQEEGVDSIKMHEDLVGWLAKQERVPENIKFLPEPSSLFKTMFGTACALAAAADRKLVNVPHFVQAMFGLQNSEAAFLLCKNVGDRQGEFLASVDSYYPLENEPGDETLMMGDGYDEDDYDNDYDEDEEDGRSRQPQDWHQLVTCISDQVEDKKVVVIENKIYADDQYQQLKRYYDSMLMEGYKPEEIELVYLTLAGAEPSEDSIKGLPDVVKENIKIISYKDDIIAWIEDCIKEAAQVPIIRETLVQYESLLKKITGKGEKTMTEEMKNMILSNKDYLDMTYKLTDVLVKIKQDLQLKFWEKLEEKLNNSLNLQLEKRLEYPNHH